MASTTTQGSGNRKNNGGSVLAGGNISNTTLWNNLTIRNNCIPALRTWGKPVSGFKTGNVAVQLGNAVSITAITQSGSTGYLNIEKSSHGLSVGDYIVVYGADVAAYNTPQRVVAVTDANNVKTDCLYTVAISSVHGSYKPFSGLFNALTKNCYVLPFVGKDTAGNVFTHLRNPGNNGGVYKFPMANGNHRYNITSWNYVTGAATKGANAGDSFTYNNISSGSALTQEAQPTMAIPGELVYSLGTATPTMADYKARTAS